MSCFLLLGSFISSFLFVSSDDAIPIRTTALFTFPLNSEVSSGDIQHFDFKRPVVDFSIVDGKSIMVSLDGEWKSSEEEAEALEEISMVKTLKLAEGGQVGLVWSNVTVADCLLAR